jgi:hypothetical protein
VLRARDAMRPVSDLAHLRGAELEAYRVEWEREARESDDRQRVPHDSVRWYQPRRSTSFAKWNWVLARHRRALQARRRHQ